ncbi:MAG: PQQ-binding-like beta-propeller repeat protein, partial [bacterium]
TGGLAPRNPFGAKKPQKDDGVQPGAMDVYVVGNYAFVACGIGGMQVVDITDSAKPNAGKDDRHGFDVPTGGIAGGVYAVGNHVYVAAGNAGIQVLEIQNFFPATGIGATGADGIAQLGIVNTPGCAMDLWINPNTSERYVYVADEKGGLQIIDVGDGFTVSNTDMTAAALLTASIPFEDAQNVFVQKYTYRDDDPDNDQTIAYVSDGANGFQMVDITDPTTPQKILGASYNTKDYTSAVWVQDSFIYAADRMAGLAIFGDYNPPDSQGRNLVNVNACYSSPHIFDLDEDGFCDMLSGDEHGYVWFFHNQGALSNPSFNDGFRIRGSSSSGLLDVGQYSSPWIVDYNGDGVKDLIVGNETGAVLFYEGYETIPLTTDSIEGLIPLATRNRYLAFKPPKTIKVSNRDIDVGLRSCPMIGDWNNDGGLDLIVGNEDGKLNVFLNTKTWPGEEPSFNASFNVRGQQPRNLQTGGYSVPYVVDWDSDGKKDLIIGDKDGYITYFHNSGTNTANPEFSSGFRPQRTGPGGMVDVKVDGYSVPIAFDWDMDGKKDLIVGDSHGKVWFFRNTNTDAAPVFGTPSAMLANNAPIDVGQYAAPFVCDWNHDGQKDLVVGNENGNVLLFSNTGTANGTPTLGTATILSNTSGDIDVGRFARPWVIDYNGDWLDDLIVGNIDGNISVYSNMGNEQCPEYDFGENIQFDDETNIDAGQCAAPCIVDWDNDGTLDLLSGHKEGFIRLFTSSPDTETIWIDESITLRSGVNDCPAFRYDAARNACDPGAMLNMPLDIYWTYTTTASIISSLVVLGDRAVVCSKDGVINVVDIADLSKSYSYPINTPIDSTPIIIGDMLYIGGRDGIIHCFDCAEKEEKWTYLTDGPICLSSPMVVNGRLYIGSSDGRMYCLNADGGELLWSYKTTGIIESSPAVSVGRVYFGSMDGNVYCIDAVNGAFKWKHNIGSAIHPTPCIKNNILYVGANDGKVYALKTGDGTLQWSYQTGKPISSSIAIDSGNLYFGGEDGVFYCLDALTGRLKWSYYMGSPIHSSPIVVNGIVYVGADNGRIYALNPEAISTNRLIWSYQTNGKILSSPAAAGNRLYVTSEDGNCYAFGPQRFLGSSKIASINGPVLPGGTVAYIINISNANGVDAITVVDELDASLIDPVNISNDGGTTTQNGRTVIIWNNINPQLVNSLSFNVSVSPDAAPEAIINNAARIEWTAGSFTIPAATIRVAGTVTAAKRMIHYKQEVSPGEAIEYSITCKNTMGITIHKLTITDEIDPNLTAIVPLNNGVYDAKTRRITWQIMSDIANGKEVVVRFQAKIASIVAGGNGTVIDNNTASFWSTDTGSNTIHAEPEIVTVSVPDFSTSVNQVRAPNVIRSGSVISYDIVYINQGAMATDVVVVAKVDDNLSVIAPSISRLGVYSPDYCLITWRLGKIGTNESGTLSYKTTVKSPVDNQTQITNTAAISCRQMETQYLEAKSVIIMANKPEFKQSSIEVFPRNGTGPYDIISYTITCANSGDMNAVETQVVDALSQYLSIGSLTSRQEVIGNDSLVDLRGNWNQFNSGMVDGNITIWTNSGTYTSKEISLANYPNVLALMREINISPAKVTLNYLPSQDRFVLECRNNGWIMGLKETGLLPFFSCIKIPVGNYSDQMASYNAISRELIWNIGEIPAGSSTTLRFKAQLMPGIGTVTNEAIIYWGTETTGVGNERVGPVYTNVDNTKPIVGQIPIEGTINNVDEDANISRAYKIFWKPWQDPESGVDMYCLQESIDMKNWGTISDSIIGTQLNYSVSNKVKGNTYYYRLKARNHAGLWSDFTPSSDGIRIVDSFGVVKTGTISTVTKDKCRVSIPNNAFVGTITLIIRKVTNPSTLYAPGRNLAVFDESIVELTALPDDYYGSNTQPIKPITLTLPYLDPDTFNEAEDYNYRIFKLTVAGWEIVAGNQVVSPENDTITVSVPSLSFYAVGRASDSVDDIVVKPNPVRGNSVKFCNATGDVWIYNTAGELVYSYHVTGGHPEWNTRNDVGELVASGIYVCVIENGQGERVTRVFGIIR